MSEAQNTGLLESGAGEVESLADSNPSTSEFSDDPSSELLHTSNLSSSKKRKVQSQKAPRSRLKRLKMSYNDDYRNLFNITVNEIVKGLPVDEADLLPMSQIGFTQWSPYEKEIFFTTLAKRGRFDLSSIAAAIGTKSELEVNVYYQLLHKATAENHLDGPRHHLVGMYEIPGAFEISQDCSAKLELNADALSILKQREEEKVEKKNYDKLWLLNEHTLPLATQRQRPEKSDETEILNALAQSEILKLKGFLDLSKGVFMNSSLAEDNWRSYCGKKQTPSILQSAFLDFHRLAISVTKRLIQSSLFFAMSRIRATTSSSYRPEKIVRPRDVSAALNVLGMKHNSQSFWIEVARRCNLAVYDKIKSPNSIYEELSYDEVEKRLGRRGEVDSQKVKYSPKPNEIAATLVTTPLSPDTDHDKFLSESISNSSFDPAGSSEDDESLQLSSQDGDRSHNPKKAEEDQDLYVEAVDMRESQREELRLWKLLGQDPPVDVKLEEIDLPVRPRPQRKTVDDLDDWSSWVDYTPEWEVHENQIPASSFATGRRRGRNESWTRLYDRTSTESGSSEGEGHEDDDEMSSSIVRTNNSHDDKNSDDEGSTSDSEGENSLDEIKSEIFEQSGGQDDTITHDFNKGGDASVDGIEM